MVHTKLVLNGPVIFLLLVFNSSNSCGQVKEGFTNEQADSMFKTHLYKLDSTAKENSKDTVFFCCPYSIEVVERATEIFSRADMNFAGKWKFFLSDLLKWKEWYLLNKSKLFWDEKRKKISVKSGNAGNGGNVSH